MPTKKKKDSGPMSRSSLMTLTGKPKCSQGTASKVLKSFNVPQSAENKKKVADAAEAAAKKVIREKIDAYEDANVRSYCSPEYIVGKLGAEGKFTAARAAVVYRASASAAEKAAREEAAKLPQSTHKKKVVHHKKKTTAKKGGAKKKGGQPTRQQPPRSAKTTTIYDKQGNVKKKITNY